MSERHANRSAIGVALVAGLVGGLAGSAAKLVGEAVYPPRTLGQEAPPALLAERIVGHPLDKEQKLIAAQGFHWTFGAGLGALYAVAADFVPEVTSGYGSVFGLAVLLGTHESVLPALGLVEPPLQQPFQEQASEVVTHVMYGVVTEVTRRFIVKRRRRTRGANPPTSLEPIT